MKSPTTLHAIPVVILAALAGIPATAVAQGTAADYARADALRARYESAAVDIAEPASAIGRFVRHPLGVNPAPWDMTATDSDGDQPKR